MWRKRIHEACVKGVTQDNRYSTADPLPLHTRECVWLSVFVHSHMQMRTNEDKACEASVWSGCLNGIRSFDKCAKTVALAYIHIRSIRRRLDTKRWLRPADWNTQRFPLLPLESDRPIEIPAWLFFMLFCENEIDHSFDWISSAFYLFRAICRFFQILAYYKITVS